MLHVNDDGSIELTRGDTARLSVSIQNDLTGEDYIVSATDTLRFTIKRTVNDQTPYVKKEVKGSTQFDIRPSGLYKCYNAITANPTWLPENTAAHWEPITVGEDGTIDNPITAAAGMRYYKDKYYLDGGKIYRCTRDDGNGQGTILQYVPSQLVGIYFEEMTQS